MRVRVDETSADNQAPSRRSIGTRLLITDPQPLRAFGGEPDVGAKLGVPDPTMT